MSKKKVMKKGISPIIATVLLISLVIVIAVIVFLWLYNFTEEAVTKFDGKNIKLVCDDIQFTADYTDATNSLKVSNNGNVPIYAIKIKMYYPSGHSTEDLDKPLSTNEWKDKGLNPGTSFNSGALTGLESGTSKIIIIPVLVGISQSGETKTYVCEDRNGIQLTI
ncbi:MAG: hypothetical protein Q7R52_00475 [archaeon]|nr:hypothetical protein [archaeon]